MELFGTGIRLSVMRSPILQWVQPALLEVSACWEADWLGNKSVTEPEKAIRSKVPEVAGNGGGRYLLDRVVLSPLWITVEACVGEAALDERGVGRRRLVPGAGACNTVELQLDWQTPARVVSPWLHA